jgi:hypothetical protein
MTHPIIALQGALVAAMTADGTLAGFIGQAIYDAPPRHAHPPYLVIARHDMTQRDGDLAPGYAHRVIIHLWHPDPSRRAVLAIADRIMAVVLEAPLTPDGLTVTNRMHQRTDTAIDLDTGHARAALTFQFFTEPA